MHKRWMNNLSTKVLSLVLAVFLWLFVIGEINPVATRDFHDIPISILNGETLKDHGLIQTDIKVETIDVRVSAKRDAINAIRSEDITAFANIAGYGEGVNNIPIRVQVPSGVSIDQVSDQTTAIKIEKLIQMTFEVEVALKEPLPPNQVLESLTASPDLVTITEPRSVIDQIESVKALVIAPDSGENKVANVEVVAFDAEGQALTEVETKPNMVNVALATSFIKELPIALTYAGTLSPDVRIVEGSVSPSTVFLKSDLTKMDEFANVRTEPIDLSSLTETVSGKVSLQLPDGVVIRDQDQGFTYQINVERKRIQDYEVTADKIEVRNLGPGLKGQVALATPLVISLKGYEADFKSYNPKDFVVWVDATDLTAGVHTLEIQLTLPESLSLEKTTVTATSVTLTQ